MSPEVETNSVDRSIGQQLRRGVFVVSAVAVGLGIGVAQHWQVLGPRLAIESGGENQTEYVSASPPSTVVPIERRGPSRSEPIATAAPASATIPEQTDAARDIPPVVLPGGVTLVLESTGRAGEVGYRVTGRSRDHRFAVGDLITAVGGTAVEASAAGSELLLAALMNPQAEVEVTR